MVQELVQDCSTASNGMTCRHHSSLGKVDGITDGVTKQQVKHGKGQTTARNQSGPDICAYDKTVGLCMSWLGQNMMIS